MSKPFIYLAGAIFGATGAEANDWRNDMTARLAPHGIGCISPLRCEPIIGDRYDTQYDDPCFGTAEAILSKNFLDLRKCDMTLVYLPTPPGVAEMRAVVERMETISAVAKELFGDVDDEDVKAMAEDAATLRRLSLMSPQRSIGTIGELSWAYALQKPVAVVSDDPLIKRHPFTHVQAGWRLTTLDEAERLIVGLFADYAK
jgi:nucleoside 2-deoxyribosyltransferase